MKESTKVQLEFKLLKWFRKLFNYTPHIQPYIVEERKIQRIQVDKLFSKEEEKLLEDVENNFKQMIEENISINIARTMLKMGAIKLEYSIREDGFIHLEAKTYVPEKL